MRSARTAHAAYCRGKSVIGGHRTQLVCPVAPDRAHDWQKALSNKRVMTNGNFSKGIHPPRGFPSLHPLRAAVMRGQATTNSAAEAQPLTLGRTGGSEDLNDFRQPPGVLTCTSKHRPADGKIDPGLMPSPTEPWRPGRSADRQASSPDQLSFQASRRFSGMAPQTAQRHPRRREREIVLAARAP